MIYVIADVSEKCSASVFRIENIMKHVDGDLMSEVEGAGMRQDSLPGNSKEREMGNLQP